jgi:hyperosmotically inducible protein
MISKRCCAVVLALLMGILPGCAAYKKCGVGGCAGDAEITAAVRAEFVKHSELQPPNVLNVQTIDGVVYLYGLVDTDLQRQIAESVAGQTPGVAKVINSIGVSGNAR